VTKEQELSQWSQFAIEEYTKSLSDEELENLYNEGDLFIVLFPLMQRLLYIILMEKAI
jgi:hypothetical protein